MDCGIGSGMVDAGTGSGMDNVGAGSSGMDGGCIGVSIVDSEIDKVASMGMGSMKRREPDPNLLICSLKFFVWNNNSYCQD